MTLVALARAAAAAVAVPASGVAGAATTKTVTLKNIRYSPTAVTISRNDKVSGSGATARSATTCASRAAASRRRR